MAFDGKNPVGGVFEVSADRLHVEIPPERTQIGGGDTLPQLTAQVVLEQDGKSLQQLVQGELDSYFLEESQSAHRVVRPLRLLYLPVGIQIGL